MKYINFKTLALIFSTSVLLALTGCGNSGTPSDDNLVGGGIVNKAPIADAGADQSVTEGDTVTLNGSGSNDPDGTIVSYEWVEGSTVLSTAVSFTKSDFSVGTHTVTLTVTDNNGTSASDSMTVTVNAANIPPVADAGADQTVTEGDTVTLNGSGSSDPDGTIASYEWKEGSTVLSTAVSFTKSDFSVGTHTITLTVTDNDGAAASDSMTVTVNAISSGPIKISKTGQNLSYDENGTVVTSLKDDGYYEYGVDFNFTNNGDSTITDNNTKLIWDQNGSTNELTMAEAEAYCTAKGAGWRIPNVYEYFSILDYSKEPALDNVYFNVPSGYYWTSTNEVGSSSRFWTIREQFASLNFPSSSDEHIRCVKGEKLMPPASGRFTKIAADGSSLDDSAVTWVAVKDSWTGLLWQESDNGVTLTWHEAINYCEELTLAGKEWYLPNIKQVHHLLDMTQEEPALDPNYFSVVDSGDVLWTSTTDMSVIATPEYGTAWSVYKGYGADISGGIYKTDTSGYGTHTALCVSSETATAGSPFLFDFCDDVHGREELWRSDGTTVGTTIVKDINPGTDDAEVDNLIEINDVYYFTAYGDGNGTELWKSDGTEAGTMIVKDIYTGIGGSSPDDLTNVNGILYFEAGDDTNGRELWKSDGTDAGTKMVKDIDPFGNSYPKNLVNVNGILYFNASNGGNDYELWRSDGTDAGTFRVKNINTTSASNPFHLTDVNGILYFSANNGIGGHELWKSDGTDAGTVMVKDIYTGDYVSSAPQNLISMNGILYFTATNFTVGDELWRSDGTEAGTVVVKDIYSGSNSGGPRYLTNLNGVLYFKANNGTDGNELWRTDGTEAGTVMVKDINSGGYANPSDIINVNGVLYFEADDGTHGRELWKSDGTAGGTVIVKDITSGDSSSHTNFLGFSNENGVLYFEIESATYDQELWKSDGTDTGTVLVKTGCAQ